MKILKNIWRVICYPLMHMGVMQLLAIGFMVVTIIGLVINNPGMEYDEIVEIAGKTLVSLSNVIMLFAVVVSFLIMWLILRKEWRREDTWNIKGFSAGLCLLCLVVAVPLSLSISGIIQFLPFDRFIPSHEQLMEQLMGKNIFVEISVVGLAVPIVEELIFRGIVLKRFLRMSMAVPMAIFLQALMFGIFHMNILQGFYTFLLAIILGLVYVWFKTVWAPIFLHIGFNMFSVLLSNLPDSIQSDLPEQTVQSDIVFAVIVILATAISAILLWLLWMNRVKQIQILAATNNRDKIEEFKRIFKPLGYTIVTPDELGIDITVEETGDTFEQNAALKAIAFRNVSNLPVIADDSGLAIDYMNGAPGVHSAKYCGENAGYDVKMNAILDNLRDLPMEKRTARFICCIYCILGEGKIITTSGVCEGHIGYRPQGQNGFGYDPIFIAGGGYLTTAEMSSEQKDAISHRGKALRELEYILKTVQ
ncbi:MAG: RdgB/HAM1 family non-canonical purine NTP pyrophosphatase [Oscillospiraceae bacterium]|nr:RdgB/HAM1 family non-canonical purine NTP pyrophosphatase [Oscillospiraceae bacterium]